MADEAVVAEVTETEPKTAKKVTGIDKAAALTVMVDSNPKRPGGASYDRFEGYFKDGIATVQDALDAGLTMGDIKYDIVHEYIAVEGAEVEEYTPSRRGPRGSSSDTSDLGELMAEGEAAEADEGGSGDLFG
jgi:hypothetical protein